MFFVQNKEKYELIIKKYKIFQIFLKRVLTIFEKSDKIYIVSTRCERVLTKVVFRYALG